MKVRKVLGEKIQFEQGNTACVYGALLAGCNFFAGYPITPASEIAEKMAELMPKLEGTYLQMEDEIASIAACIGASWVGKKSMTATSGPGFSLMQENLGYAVMTETPVVVVDVMRSGPSTGQPTYPAQGDVMQARWGTHGDHEIIALYPNSVQETFFLTVEAFNLSEKYRNPVILLMDAELAHMREKLVIPDEVEVFERVKATIDFENYQPYRTGFTHPGSKVPEFAFFGSGYTTNVTGLTHDEKGFPVTNDSVVHKKLVERLCYKIRNDVEKISIVEECYTEDAEIGILSYGVTSRATLQAVEIARKKGFKVGYVRLASLWPFPEKKVKRATENMEKIYVPELNLGQIYHKVRETTCKEVVLLPKIGGEVFNPTEILKKIGVGV